MKPPQPWQTLHSEKVFQAGHWLQVEMRTVATPDGRQISGWPWVTTPDYVNVVPVTAQGEFLCFRQDKYAFPELSLAPVGGYIEPGEDPLSAAQRELMEEMGCQAERWLPLGSYWVDPNRGVATGHLYLALGARQVAERDADDLEAQELVHLTRAQVEAALDAGEFRVLAWAANLVMALRVLDRM
jgi:ADP-ribose pyrophosphatase